MNEEARKIYYEFGPTSFKHEIWINHKHTFPNKSPHGLCIDVLEETYYAFSLEVCDEHDHLVGKATVPPSPQPARWVHISLYHDLNIKGPGPFRLKLHNESQEEKMLKKGIISDCSRSLAGIELRSEEE